MKIAISQLKSIINPVRELKMQDWLKIADLVLAEDESYADMPNYHIRIAATGLIENYESLTSQKLTKEMFVCGVEEPEKIRCKCPCHKNENMRHVVACCNNGFIENVLGEKSLTYQAAQEKIWFEGFKEISKNVFSNGQVEIVFIGNDVRMNIKGESDKAVYDIAVSTIHNIEFHIDFYNRTAKEPIKLNYSENLIKELVK